VFLCVCVCVCVFFWGGGGACLCVLVCIFACVCFFICLFVHLFACCLFVCLFGLFVLFVRLNALNTDTQQAKRMMHRNNVLRFLKAHFKKRAPKLLADLCGKV